MRLVVRAIVISCVCGAAVVAGMLAYQPTMLVPWRELFLLGIFVVVQVVLFVSTALLGPRFVTVRPEGIRCAECASPTLIAPERIERVSLDVRGMHFRRFVAVCGENRGQRKKYVAWLSPRLDAEDVGRLIALLVEMLPAGRVRVRRPMERST